MRHAVALALGLSALAACTAKNTAKYPSAAVTAGAAVAVAGVYRAATGGCWASCAPGQECDEVSGTCVDLPCHGECPAEHRCVDGACVRGVRDVAGPSSAPLPASTADAGPGEPCGGLCFPSELCVADAGRPECRPRPPR